MAPSVDPASAARALRDAEPGDGFVPLFTERHPGLTWTDARAIALARDELRRADGEEHIGYKLGWTSSAMREALGIDQPNWGTLWSTHRLDGTLDRGSFRHPKIEPELVYVAGERLGTDATVEQVVASAAGWAVGLEVVDPRFVDFGFRWLDNTADNSSAGGIAVGQVMTPPDIDPAAWRIMFDDGVEQRDGIGEVVMGSPAAAVTWLAHRLAEEGADIEPGMIVFSGGMAAPFDATPGTRYTATCPELGSGTSLDVV